MMMRRMMLRLMAVALSAMLLSCAGSQAFQRGERYADRGEWDLAVKEYREANKRDPHDIEYRSALIRAEETAANQHYKRARDFLKERKLDQAITELQQALYLNPSNAAIQSALKSVLNIKQAEDHYRVSLTFVELNRLGEAINEMNQAVELDPENTKYRDVLDKLQKKRAETEPEDALSLASDKPITLNFKNTNIKDVFEFLSKLSGINILFDEEVKAQPVTIFVKDVSFQYALNLLLSTNKLFMKKISADTIIIIPKSKTKTDQYQDLEVKTFYINNAKAKDIINLIRSMLDVKKVYVNDIQNSITVRETPEKIKLVGKIIAANDLKEAEVILDVEILEISRDNSLNYGWNFSPGLSASASVLPFTNTEITSSTGAVSLNQLMHLNGNSVFVTLPSLVVNMIKQDSDAQTLANPRVRVLNHQVAKFHIGNKVPIQTSTIQSTATVAVTSTFEYKDIGIKLNIEPTVHLNSTVTLKLGMEVSTLGNALDFGNGQKQYEFGTRNVDTVINLRDGETVIIGGLIGDNENKTITKIPILGDIPILGKLFSSTDNETVKTDILMSIKPNIVRNMELPDKETQAFWSGTEEQYDTKPLFVSESGKSSKAVAKTYEKSAVLDVLSHREPASISETKPAPVSAPVVTAVGQPSSGVAVALTEVKPAEVVSSVGQDARFDVSAGTVKGLYGAIITLSYDPSKLEFNSANEGMLLRKDGQQTSFLFSNNAKAGTVDIYMTRIGNVGGIDGSGTLCALIFQGKSGGTSEILVKNVKLTNSNREPIKTDTRGARVIVK
ncbi:MAG TPA: cohesin domain-containing protein [Nitrospirota bacterium]|nr:cohesin domain-containing protein [Nitrospirota bacterium]